jgi:hypothetical protein
VLSLNPLPGFTRSTEAQRREVKKTAVLTSVATG